MKNNSNMNDIFANDNSARNKTKTIFLLSIVAIILIAVFLIIAWVMTRDNTIQPLETQGENERIQSPQKEIPYAHSEDTTPNPNIINSPDNQLGLNLDSGLTTTPPPNLAQNQTPQTPQIPGFQPVAQPDSNVQKETPNFLPPPVNTQNTPNYEDDPKYQENLKNLQAQQTAKNAQQVNTTQKVVTPPPPVELKPSDKKDAKKDSKDAKTTPPPAATKDSKAIQNRAVDSKQAEAKKPESKPTESKTAEKKPATTAASDKKDDKILQRPAQPTNKNNGTPAQKGHYIQVGSFPEANKVDTLFMQNIQKYGYRIQKFDNNGVPFVRYLVGPYKDQQEAKSKLNEVKTQINGNAIYKEVK
ncbi:SPOR domain-containing protein [Helicobacter saguini]|uniref:SPOR domain-containing protein n=1 Tax=Helicobacter saguini TaxID=1548018 RepID=A0A347VSJ3_9HELI|nr:SPOR domain-containing protein [Helicobacter saguini]MWV62483.1 SPOR domain-containing protein [Helicobacter saguini]MWV66844.1 SPOR domain-containing protein [Helicobacter saguini]MWV69194.1 SPOR domain-containing protein [Helicobacter saguini]MWV71251.1 SPOR domain-containing protein [Helicobacter saguini]TLD94230.1 SPOR domain-containing protein [Helicobacter saguini]